MKQIFRNLCKMMSLVSLLISCDSNPKTTTVQRILQAADSVCGSLEETVCQAETKCLWNVDSCEALWKTNLPVLPEGIKEVKHLKVDDYVCAIDKENKLWCMHSDSSKDIHPHSSRQFIEVETQADRVCGVLIDGSGLCFTNGKKDSGLSFSQKLSKLYPFGAHICGIYEDGSVFCDGNNSNLADISNLISASGFKKVTEMTAHSQDYSNAKLGVLDENGLFEIFEFDKKAWKSFWPHIHAKALVGSVVSISMAISQFTYVEIPDFCYIKRTSNELNCLGLNYIRMKKIKVPKEIKNQKFAAISVGDKHTCGILINGNEAKCWGDGTGGHLNIPINLAGIKSIVAGNEITCYIDGKDNPHCVGRK